MKMPVDTQPVLRSALTQLDFEELYLHCFPDCARWIAKMGGNLEDARDIFQDALVIFCEKSSSLNFDLSENAYILGIVKHLWIRKFKKDVLKVSFDNFERTIVIPDDYFPSVDTIKLLDFLESTGRNCLALLRSFYYEKLSMKQIAQKMNYAGERSVTVQKFKCIEKLKNAIKQRSIGYEDFLE